MLYVQYVKENKGTLTLAKYTLEIGRRLHSAMRTIETPLAHECPNYSNCRHFIDIAARFSCFLKLAQFLRVDLGNFDSNSENPITELPCM